MLPGMGAPQKETQNPPQDPVVKKLQEIDPNGMTPLQALNTLHEWKKKYA
jgi:DNA mismatch repair protein MutS